jgi:YaiO family outer membrane protein
VARRRERVGAGITVTLLLLTAVPPAPADTDRESRATASEQRTRAQRMSRSGDLAESLELYDGLVARFPNDLDLRLERARVLAWTGLHGEASASARTVVESDPSAVEGWALLTDIRVWEGDLAGAREVLGEGLSHAPEAASLHERRARLEYRDGNVGDARAHMTRAVNLDPQLVGGRRALFLYSPWIAEAYARHEHLTDGDPWRNFALSLRWRPYGKWSASVSGEQIQRFSQSELAARIGVERLLPAGNALWGTVGVAPGAEVVAEWDAAVGVTWRPTRLWRTEGAVQELAFSSGSAHVARAAGIRILPAGWEVGYGLTWARDVAGNDDTTHSLRALWAPAAWSALSIEAYLGSDVERLSTVGGDVTRTTLGLNAGWRLVGSRGWGIRLQAGYANRRDDYRRTSIGVGVIRHLR